MLKQKAQELRDQKELGYNCAECVVLAANEELNLNLSKDTITALGAYGGGAGCGSLCGALAGAIGVLGVVNTDNTKASRFSPKTAEKTSEMVAWFQETYGSELCNYIKEQNELKGINCDPLIVNTANKLQELID